MATTHGIAGMQITRPVILSCGTRSHTTLKRTTRSLAATIPGARIQEIEAAGHAAAFDAPASFAHITAEATQPNLTPATSNATSATMRP